jgi:hypothetical protein
MKRVITAAFLALAAIDGNAQQSDFLSLAPEPQNYAWWLRAEFHPFGKEVRGIPVGRIRSTWCKATEFRKDLFPPELASDFDQNGGVSFDADGFFDGSKTKQTALLGVYESCTGERGTFLLVLSRPRSGQPTIRFLREMPGPHQFAVLGPVQNSTISVFLCMECDLVTQFKWNKSKGRFVQLPAAF